MGLWFHTYKAQRQWIYISNVDMIVETSANTQTRWNRASRDHNIIRYQIEENQIIPCDFYVNAILVYPTTQHTDFLRITVTPRHGFMKLDYLCPYYDVLQQFYTIHDTNHTQTLYYANSLMFKPQYLNCTNTISDSSFSSLLDISNVYITSNNAINPNKPLCGWLISNGEIPLYSGKLLFDESTNNTPLRALVL